MENINYDLVKLLHATADVVWRLENHYIKDAKAVNCHSVATLGQILEDEKKHIDMLTEEIKMRAGAGAFN